jgi:hypothetical protein
MVEPDDVREAIVERRFMVVQAQPPALPTR